MSKWDLRFIQLAREVAGWSKDPKHQVGSVAVSAKGQVLSQGYNGFPRGMEDTDVRYQDRDLKRKLIVHAEQNVIYNATYTGVSLDGATLYISGLPPCHECTKGIIQTGIARVVIDNEQPRGWAESWALSKEMLAECNIELQILQPTSHEAGQTPCHFNSMCTRREKKPP